MVIMNRTLINVKIAKSYALSVLSDEPMLVLLKIWQSMQMRHFDAAKCMKLKGRQTAN